LQHLVDILDNSDAHEHEAIITYLCLESIYLSLEPSDGGLEVLRTFFARGDTTLTRVILLRCKFGSQDDASRLLAACQSNRTITDMTIYHINNLRGDVLGNSLSSLMQDMPQLQRPGVAVNTFDGSSCFAILQLSRHNNAHFRGVMHAKGEGL
jgi:hypothetical protein